MLKNAKKSVVGYFDFETYNLTNYKFGIEPLDKGDKQAKEEKPIAVYGAGLLIEGIAYTGFGLDAIERFGQKLIEITKGKEIILIAHNCSYDFALLNEYGHTNGYSKIKMLDAAQTDDDRAWLGAKVNVDGVKIRFLDTGIGDKNCSLGYYSDVLNLDNIQKGSLEHYEKGNVFEDGGSLGFYDSEGKVTQLNIQDEQEYLLNDIKLLPKVDEYIHKTKKLLLKTEFMPPEEEGVNSFEKCHSKLTKAGFAKSCFEICIKDFYANTYKTQIDQAFYLEQIRSFIGGFTSGNKYITKLDLNEAKIKSYDVNSLYPSIMAQPLPIGEIMYSKPRGKTPYCQGYRIRGTKCEYKKKYDFLDCPIISTRFQEVLKVNRKLVENKELTEPPTFIILKEYYDVISEYCEHNLEIVNIMYQELSNILAPFIEEAYDMRVVVKKNNKDLADSIKLFLNSGFGKFGERTHEKVIVGDEKIKCGTKVKAKDSDYYTNLLTGLYVCSKARCKLMLAIKQEIENGNTFLYCDTDSIKLVVNNPVKLDVDPDKLGAGKDEGTYNIGRYPLKRKRYYSYNSFTGDEKITCGGFNKGMISELEYQDKLDFFDDKLNVVIKGGKRVRYTGQILDKTNPNYIVPYRNKYGLTKLYEIDISTTNKLNNPDRIIYKDRESNKGIMKQVNEQK